MKHRNTMFCVLLGAALSTSMNGMAPRPKPGDPKPPPYSDEQLLNNAEEVQRAEKYFAGKIIVMEPAYPFRMAGAIAYSDDIGEIKTINYTRLLPDEKPGEPEAVKLPIFEAIVESQFAANVSYLSFISGSFEATDKAVVNMEVTLRGLGPQFLTNKVKEALPKALEALKKPGRRFFYLETVQYVVASSSRLKKQSAAGTGAFYVQIGADWYQSETRASTVRLGVAEYIEITATGGPTPYALPLKPKPTFAPSTVTEVTMPNVPPSS